MPKVISASVAILALALLVLSLLPVAQLGGGRDPVAAGEGDDRPGVPAAAPENQRRPVVPEEYRQDVTRAGQRCAAIDAALVAAQIHTESGWNPRAVSPAGAQGISQVLPSTWREWGADHDGDGVADPFEPADAIGTQAAIMCHTYGWVQAQLARGRLSGDPLDLTLASYNAGPGAVNDAGGVPPYPETLDYVRLVRERAGEYASAPPAAGAPRGMSALP